MTDADEFARDHIAAFNDAVVRSSFEAFVTRFNLGAVVRFENVPGAGTLEFSGRAAISEAYSEQPPDDEVDIDGAARDEAGTIVIPFTWRRDGARGEMRVVRDGTGITNMTVVFE